MTTKVRKNAPKNVFGFQKKANLKFDRVFSVALQKTNQPQCNVVVRSHIVVKDTAVLGVTEEEFLEHFLVRPINCSWRSPGLFSDCKKP